MGATCRTPRSGRSRGHLALLASTPRGLAAVCVIGPPYHSIVHVQSLPPLVVSLHAMCLPRSESPHEPLHQRCAKCPNCCNDESFAPRQKKLVVDSRPSRYASQSRAGQTLAHDLCRRVMAYSYTAPLAGPQPTAPTGSNFRFICVSFVYVELKAAGKRCSSRYVPLAHSRCVWGQRSYPRRSRIPPRSRARPPHLPPPPPPPPLTPPHMPPPALPDPLAFAFLHRPPLKTCSIRQGTFVPGDVSERRQTTDPGHHFSDPKGP